MAIPIDLGDYLTESGAHCIYFFFCKNASRRGIEPRRYYGVMMEVGEADSAGSVGPKPGSGLHFSSVIIPIVGLSLRFAYRIETNVQVINT